MLINYKGKFVSTINKQSQSSSFLNEDLVKGTSEKNYKKIFSYWDNLRILIFGAIARGISRTKCSSLKA